MKPFPCLFSFLSSPTTSISVFYQVLGVPGSFYHTCTLYTDCNSTPSSTQSSFYHTCTLYTDCSSTPSSIYIYLDHQLGPRHSDQNKEKYCYLVVYLVSTALKYQPSRERERAVVVQYIVYIRYQVQQYEHLSCRERCRVTH